MLFSREVEIALEASFVEENFFQALGIDYEEPVLANYKGYISPELTLCGKSIVISSELFNYQGPISDNVLSGHGVLSLYKRDHNGRPTLQERYEGIFCAVSP